MALVAFTQQRTLEKLEAELAFGNSRPPTPIWRVIHDCGFGGYSCRRGIGRITIPIIAICRRPAHSIGLYSLQTRDYSIMLHVERGQRFVNAHRRVANQHVQ